MLIADTFDPAVHEVYEGALAKYVRSELREDDLFVYRHKGTGNWVIAIWEPGSEKRMFREIVNMGPSLASADRRLLHELKYVWQGPPSGILKRLEGMQRAEINRRREEDEEFRSALKFLKKRGKLYDSPAVDSMIEG